MSTPIKPPGDPTGADSTTGVEDGNNVAAADGAFRSVVDEASAPESAASAESVGALSTLESDLSAGRATAESVVEQLVQRALASATGLPEGERAALEAQLRQSLEGDPTLIALQEDLQRAASKA